MILPFPSLQVTEALIFLHSLHYLHAGLSSHAVMMVSSSVTKLGLLDWMVSQGENKTESLETPDHLAGWRCPHCPQPGVHCDVFSLCTVLLELCSGLIVQITGIIGFSRARISNKVWFLVG